MDILAKQLVKIRNQKAQSLQASGQIQSLATQNTMMASNIKMANAMQSTAKTMAKMNKVMNPAQMTKITQQFTQEHTKLDIKGEMSKIPELLLSFRRICRILQQLIFFLSNKKNHFSVKILIQLGFLSKIEKVFTVCN